MRIFVDGIIFSLQKKGGLSRIFAEVLSAMRAQDKTAQITLFAPSWPANIAGKCLAKLHRFCYLRLLSNPKGTIWYSSYYTLPPKPWNGPVVMLVADLIHELYPHFFTGQRNEEFRERKRHCILSADAIICISETTKQDVIKYYGVDASKVYAVKLSHTDHFQFMPELLKAKREIEKSFLLYIGTRVHYKNFDFLMKAFAQWQKSKNIDIVLVGPPLNDAEKTALVQLGIIEHVHVLDGVDDQRLRVLYHQALAFVYPSIYEGFGIPLLEAMACDCLVIASDIPSSREIAGDVPFYFRLDDMDGLIGCMDAVGQTQGSDCRQKGIAHAALYSWDRTAKESLTVFKHILVNWENQ